MKRTTYEINESRREKLERIDDYLDPETSEVVDEAGLDALMNEIAKDESDIKQKICDIAAYIQELKALSSDMGVAIKSISSRRSGVDHKIERLASFLLYLMKLWNLPKVEGAQVRVTVAKKPDSVNVVNEADIPDQYWKPQPPVLNRAAIKEALKKGEEVPGAAMNAPAYALRIK